MMTNGGRARGMIAVDKIGTQVLFLNPETFETEVVLDGFPKTVHELLIVPETGLAYVPIYGDGIHGRNPNPGHELAIFDLAKRAHVGDIDLRPYIAPHTLKLGPDGLIYMTCENSAVVVVIDRSTHKVVDAIDSGSTNGHRLIIAPDGKRLYTENEEDGAVSIIDLPARKLLGKIKTPEALAGITIAGDNRTIVVVSDETPSIFLIDAEKGEVSQKIPLKGAPKPAQIARYKDDYSVLAVSAVGGDTLTLFYGGFDDQTTLTLGSQPMDMVFHGNDLFVACQGDGSVHVVDLPLRAVRKVFQAGKGCESLGFF
jgi:DNA-binding beta-propeller fold protein YncE